MSPVDARPTLHLPMGLPGSGKSTLSRGLAESGVVHVELDVIRRRVWPGCPRSWDPYTGEGLAVQAAFEAAVLRELAAGRDVCADRTNLDGRGVARLRLLAPQARVVRHDLTAVPLETCIARDAARPVATRVGEAGIRELWRRWLSGTGSGGGRAPDPAYDPSMPLAARSVRLRRPEPASRSPGSFEPFPSPLAAIQSLSPSPGTQNPHKPNNSPTGEAR